MLPNFLIFSDLTSKCPITIEPDFSCEIKAVYGFQRIGNLIQIGFNFLGAIALYAGLGVNYA